MAEPNDARSPTWLRWAAIWIILLAIPIVPFTIVALVSDQDPFQLWAESVRGRASASAAVCFALLVSDVALPVPSSVVAIVSGASLGAWAGGALNWIAITLGHVIGFGVARRWGRPAAERWLGAASLDRAGKTWGHGATAALILTRPIPVLAEAMAMFAGLTSFSFRRFLVVAALANAPHSFIYSWAGARLHGSLTALMAAGVGVPTLAYLGFSLWRRGD